MAGLTDYYENVLGIDASRIRYIEEDFVAAQIRSSKTVYVLAYGDLILHPRRRGRRNGDRHRRRAIQRCRRARETRLADDGETDL